MLLRALLLRPFSRRTYSQRARKRTDDQGHYRTLGVSPKASRADIKQAYYKLSQESHPDKNEGSEEAADRFRKLTEAYEVLGTDSTRKLYDERWDPNSKEEEEGPVRTRTRYAGRTDRYDFDEWTRSHYSDMFERKAESLRAGAARSQAARKARHDLQVSLMKGIALACGMVLLASLVGHALPTSEDAPVKKRT